MANTEKKRTGAGRSRRDVLKVIGTAPAALVPLVPFRTESATQAAPAATVKPYQPKVFDPHEWKTISRLSDLIIPADERSGSASQAGVPEFIDDWLDFGQGTLLTEIRGGLSWLDLEANRLFGQDFVDCSSPQQTTLLDRVAYPAKAAPEDAHAVTFFNRLRDLVMAGFFSSETGVKDLPYLGNQMLAEWHGCPDEVLAKLHLDRK
jgi:hypothetical protein